MKKSSIASLVLAGGLVLSTHSISLAATSSGIINTGQQYLGKPYVYGAAIGDVNEFDCSSFTATVFKQNGIILPRVAADQAQMGVEVQEANLQPGDLVFFDTDFTGTIDHVGIYIGNGQMISAILSGVKIEDINSSYWSPRYVTARRILGVQPAVSNSASTNNKVYTVVSGDSLWSISSQFGLSIAQLKAYNNLTSDNIYPGQILNLSGEQMTTGTAASPASSAPVSTTLPVSQPVTLKSTTYKVQSGDSLWAIAQKFNLSVSQLEAINKLTSDLIFPGQTLSVTSTAATSSTVNTSSQVSTELVDQSKPTGGSQTTAAQTATYVVQTGDSLWGIANQEGVSLSELESLNNITSDIIYPGQQLILKKSSGSSNSSGIQVLTASAQVPAPLTYTVQKDDTLWEIALLNDTNTKKLMKNNNLSSPFIFPGQILVL